MKNHYLIVPDNRGYGLSEKPAEMEKMAKRLQAQDMDYPEMLLGVSFMDMPTEYIYQEMTCTQIGSHHWDQLFETAPNMGVLTSPHRRPGGGNGMAGDDRTERR